MQEYIIYNAKDELLYVGNYKECAEYLECTKNLFYVLLNRKLHNKHKKMKYKIYKLED